MISMLLIYYKYDFYILNIPEFIIENLNKKLYNKLFFTCFIIIYYNLLIFDMYNQKKFLVVLNY